MNTHNPLPGAVPSLHQLIEHQVARTPELEALRFKGQSLSYAELDRRANQLAHYLRELGVGPDDIVGLYMERSLELVIALLAILKAGGAYLPIDTSYPAPRVQFLLDDAQVPVVLTQQHHAGKLDDFCGTVLPMDVCASFLAQYPGHAPEHLTQPGDLAYVIYTSGSTGQPKGCLLSHGAIVNRLVWMQDEYGLRPGDRVLQKTPYTFDVSVWEFFWPLLTGATLVLAAPQGHKDAHYLVQAIRAERITMCHFVPSMLRFFLNDAEAATCATLRDVFTSGEALPFDLVRRFKQTLGSRLHNLYGPTEAAVDVSYWACEIRPDGKVPIGRAIRNIRLYILDADRRPVPTGTEGELYIAGVGLARGYLNRPELTRDRFVDDPFHPGEKMYRTGDRTVELEDGNIDFLGRVDFQVKLRGLRIELGEIENRLRQFEGVREVAVLVRGEDEGDAKLVAYLESASGVAVDPRQVRRFVAAELPEYMVPSLVVSLPQLPVNVHGKLDRDALPWPLPAAPAPVAAPSPAPVATAVVAPPAAQHDAGVPARVGDIVAAMLKAGAIAPDADLFDLGATSLTLVRIVEQIRNEFAIAVPLDVFLDEPTIAGIAGYVVQQGGRVAAAPPSPPAPADSASATMPEAAATADAPVAPPSLPDLQLPAVPYRAEARVAEGAATRWSPGTVTFEAFSAWIGLLMAGIGSGETKYRHPSGGGLNPVRTYLVVRQGGVAGVPPGSYCYEPERHTLHAVGGQGVDAATAFGADAARLAEAAFAVVFIAEMQAIEPLYQQASATLVALEAGYMGQLLLAAQDAHGLACAPTTGLDADCLPALLDLSSTECFVHALLVGLPATGGAAAASVDIAAMSAFAARACVRHDAAESVFAGKPRMSVTSDQMHAERRHLRRFAAGTPAVALAPQRFDWAEHALRATTREYESQPVGRDGLGRLLGLLRRQSDAGPRPYLYGGLCPKRAHEVYVYLRAHDLPEGLYRYDAPTHRLVAVAPLNAAQMEQVYTPYNRQHFKRCSFCLFVFGRLDPAVPRQVALHAALVDAGYMGQLLMDRQAEFGLGLCPIGAIRFEKIHEVIGLSADLTLLHTFIGGASSRPVPASRVRIEAAGRPEAEAPAKAVAIVGLSTRLPGADTLAQFWRNLSTGVDSIGPLPPGRAADLDGATLPMGGYLPDIASFDSLLFGIAPVEARGLDPQERVLLEEVWACLETAGYTAASLAAACPRVGVFVGAMWNDYQSVGLDRWHASGRAEEFSHHASLANRISFVFDFDGPSMAVNTSCASALSALHFAAESIRRGECDAAIVGGVNLLSHPYHARMLADLGLLSKDGRACPLSSEASGWAPGEGAGAVLLKALPAAERDGDTIHALIQASAIGHSGRSMRYGAPHMQRQAQHLRRLLSIAGLAPADVDYIEAAAPGASLADAAEMHAVQAVFGQSGRTAPCRVGTVKGNIGHLESASGMSQLAKVLLQLRHGAFAPSLHSEPRNPLIAFDEGTLSVVAQAAPWPAAGEGAARRPRRALINSIGAAGSVGHVLIAEYLAPPRALLPSAGPQVVLVSAATPDQLHAQLARLLDFIDDAPDTALADLAHTLRVGRVPLRERLALVADDLPTLARQLRAVVAGEGDGVGLYRGVVEPGRAAAARAGGAEAQLLAAAWVRGDDVDWAAFERPGQRRIPLPTCAFERVRHWLDRGPGEARVALHRPTAPAATATATADPAPAEPAPTGELEPRTHAWLVRELAQASGVPAARIGLDQPLETLGLNSLIIQTLIASLERGFPDLPKTVFFEHRTLRSLATRLMQEHRADLVALLGLPAALAAAPTAAPTSARSPTVSMPAPAHTAQPLPAGDIAIVGLAGRYPQADTLQDFWRNLAAGRDCIEEVPPERWDHRRYAEDAERARPSRWGGFLHDADAFDPLFFGIAPLEAERMDPQERLFLQTAWQVLEDAGYHRAALAAHCQNRVGVFVGVMYSEYQLYPSLPQGLSISGSYGSIANRVSYVLNLSGPSMAVDTMCSSSLTALHLACESIHRGDCAWAIAGGVNLSLHPSKYATHAMLNMPSSDGRCHSFGAGGDGFVPGEGVGAVLLKPLAQALADGDHVHGVIKATAINHGGKTNGYTVPNPEAQQALIATALRRAAIDPRTISCIEAHGTGTSLGDPIEIAGLSRAFAEHTADRQFCAIGSVKSNIGHAESAAGIAGLTKLLLQMRHGQLVPSLHAEVLNPHIDFTRTPFVLQREAAPWPRPEIEIGGQRQVWPRRAGISSFGAGGSNVHVIVEEAPQGPPPSARPAGGPPALVVLSARTAPRLQEQVAQLLGAVQQGLVTDDNLIDAAYTLQVGREAMDERLALVADSAADLAAKLSGLCDGTEVDGVHRDQGKRQRGEFATLSADDDMADTVEAWIRKGKYTQLLALWVKGFAFDWNRLYGAHRPRRMSLPTYPFARDRYWLAPVGGAAVPAAGRVVPASQRRSGFDRGFFENLFKAVDSDQLSIDGALAQARRKF